MNNELISKISEETRIKTTQITSVINLLDEGNTIPFIARYRKEATGNLDEEQINLIHTEWNYQNTLLKRKEDVIRLIDEKGLLTPELSTAINNAKKLVEVEDIYRPFKEKKKTKATDAIANGLEPLAKWMMTFPFSSVLDEAKKYVNDKVKTPQDAIQGAQYIIAEMISDDSETRKYSRLQLEKYGQITSKKKKDAVDEKKVYEIYYDFSEPINKIPSHRILAINRADNDKVVSSSLVIEKENILSYIRNRFIKNNNSTAAPYVIEVIEDSYKRLIFPSIEREVFAMLFEKAENKAIETFGLNLYKLLLQPPLQRKIVLGVDPGFRTGCKLTVVDANGTVQAKGVMYPHEKRLGDLVNQNDLTKALELVKSLVNEYKVDIVAIGNGTASRETETFISNLIKKEHLACKYVIVSEAGASVYSASDLAREEFPDYSVEERSAASIARRLQDPLSELVKIEPKAIGVGQYQHDVGEKKLVESLDFIVTKAVNSVGVDVNTASKSLLMYISGLNKSTAEEIVKYRQANGAYKNRTALKRVPKLGAKTYEQAVGFMRIGNGDEPLDITSIHPESYKAAKQIMKTLDITPDMFGKQEIIDKVNSANKTLLIQETGIDMYTLQDILDSFVAPLRDPRDEFPQPILKSDILKIEDLKPGMELEGTVRNVVDFGAFIDIGLKNDGLMHISKMSKSYVSNPHDVLKVGDIVTVYILEVNLEKGKVSLSAFKE